MTDALINLARECGATAYASPESDVPSRFAFTPDQLATFVSRLSGEGEVKWRKAVQEAYGWLWHVNNEPMAPVPMWSPEQAAYEARKNLRDLLTKEQRGEAINAVAGLLHNKTNAVRQLAQPTGPASRAAQPTDAEILSCMGDKQPVRHHHGAAVFEYRLFGLIKFARAVLALAAGIPAPAGSDADGEAFRTAAKFGMTLRFDGVCRAQSGMYGEPIVYKMVNGSDRAACMREAVSRAAADMAGAKETK